MYTTLISTHDLAVNLDNPNFRIFDCRGSLADPESGRRAYQEGHIEGALYAHLEEDLSGPIVPGETGRHPLPDIDELARTFSRWGIERMRTQVVVYDDLSGAFAARLWWLLRWLGHDWVAVLDGGYPQWVKEGRRIATGTTPTALTGSVAAADFHPTLFVPEPRPHLIAEADFVDRARQDPAYVVIDARAAERYRGEVEPIDPVAGHIPGAVNAPFAGNIDSDGKFHSQERLRERFRHVFGGREAAKAISYCGSGVTAAHNVLAALHAGLGDMKLYPGSWSEWITDEGREVERGE